MKKIAHVELPVKLESLRVSVYFIRVLLETLDLPEDIVMALEVAAEEVISNVIEHSGLTEEDFFELDVWNRAGAIEVVIREKGVPVSLDEELERVFDKTAEDFVENPEEKGLGFYILNRLVDEVEFHYEARRGKVIKLVKRLPYDSILSEKRREYDFEVDFSLLKSGFLGPDDALLISQCIWHVYGYSYLWDVVYYPQKLAKYIESGDIIPYGYWYELEGEKRLVAHCALENPGDWFTDVEIGMAVVVKNVRKKGLLKVMTDKLIEFAKNKLRKKAVFVQAVANHPVSQRVALKNGFVPTAFLLSFLPAGMNFDGSGLNKRGAVVVFYKVFERDKKVLFVPFKYADFVEGIYKSLKLEINIIYPELSWDEAKVASEVKTLWREDQKSGYVFIKRAGFDLVRILEERIRSFKAKGAASCYVDVCLEDEKTASFVDWLLLDGFTVAGILPEHIEGEDYLRMQWIDKDNSETKEFELVDEVSGLVKYVLSEVGF